jgi:hypothetical protein
MEESIGKQYQCWPKNTAPLWKISLDRGAEMSNAPY